MMQRLQAAVNSSSYGDTIIFHGSDANNNKIPGLARGQLVLPRPQGNPANGYVTIQGDPALLANLPTLDPSQPWLGMVDPTYAQYMSVIENAAGGSQPAIITQPAACYWKFQGIEIRPHAVDGHDIPDWLIRLDYTAGNSGQGQSVNYWQPPPTGGYLISNVSAGSNQMATTSMTGIVAGDQIGVDLGTSVGEVVTVISAATGYFFANFGYSHTGGSTHSSLQLPPKVANNGTIYPGTGRGIFPPGSITTGLAVGDMVILDGHSIHGEVVVLTTVGSNIVDANITSQHPAHCTWSPGLPHHFWFEQCYIHMYTDDASMTGKACILANVAWFTLNHSYMDECKNWYFDCQCFNTYTGPGPFQFVGSTLIGTGENILFGGADSTWNVRPGDIVDFSGGVANGTGIFIQYCLFSKHLKWNSQDVANYQHRADGHHYVCKNIIEFKSGVNFVIDRCRLERSWGPYQNGGAVVLELADYSGSIGFEQIQTGTIQNLWIDSVDEILEMSYSDIPPSSGQLIKNIIFDNVLVTNLAWSPDGQENGGTGAIRGGIYSSYTDTARISHVTARLAPVAFSTMFFYQPGDPGTIPPGVYPVQADPVQAVNFMLVSNLAPAGGYPFDSANWPSNVVSRDRYDNGQGGGGKFWAPNATLQGNVLVNNSNAEDIVNYFFLQTFSANALVQTEAGIGYVGDQNTLSNNSLSSTSPYYNPASFPSGFSTYDGHQPGRYVPNLTHIPASVL